MLNIKFAHSVCFWLVLLLISNLKNKSKNCTLYSLWIYPLYPSTGRWVICAAIYKQKLTQTLLLDFWIFVIYHDFLTLEGLNLMILCYHFWIVFKILIFWWKTRIQTAIYFEIYSNPISSILFPFYFFWCNKSVLRCQIRKFEFS